MEVFKVLIFWKDTPQTPIYCGSTKTLVSVYHILITLYIMTINAFVIKVSTFCLHFLI